jgi:hypothetical protein
MIPASAADWMRRFAASFSRKSESTGKPMKNPRRPGSLVDFEHTMFRDLLKATWQRALFALFLAILLVGCVGIAFALRYRGYPLQFRPEYLVAAPLAWLLLEVMGVVNRRLDSWLPWDKRFAFRLVIETGSTFLLTLFAGMAFRFALVYPKTGYVQLGDELLVAVILLTSAMLFVLADMGLFLLRKWRYSVAELERFKGENAEFRLEMLRAQVNPHFLFNSLNTLASLVHRDADTASTYVRKLAAVYRQVLEHRAKEVVHLQEELNLLDDYLFLMKLRFRDRLVVHVQASDRFREFGIAQLSLQMLIENAIKHNAASDAEPLVVNIRAFAEAQGDGGWIEVNNPIRPRIDAHRSSTGTGLENIANRYAFLTDRKVEVEREDGCFIVRLPLLQLDEISIPETQTSAP